MPELHTITDRIKFYRDSKGYKKGQFEVMCGLSNGYLNSTSTPSSKILEDILRICHDLNRDWVMNGTEPMLKDALLEINGDTIYGTIIPLLPISAQAGSLNEFIVSVKDSDCERIISPIKGVDFAISVAGESMSPEYPSGSQVLVKKINEKAFIDWGKTFVLDTCNGTVIKVVVPSAREGYVRCLSINPDPRYAPYEISLEDVKGFYRVLLCMSIK